MRPIQIQGKRTMQGNEYWEMYSTGEKEHLWCLATILGAIHQLFEKYVSVCVYDCVCVCIEGGIIIITIRKV